MAMPPLQYGLFQMSAVLQHLLTHAIHLYDLFIIKVISNNIIRILAPAVRRFV